jgi:hypothetical protein
VKTVGRGRRRHLHRGFVVFFYRRIQGGELHLLGQLFLFRLHAFDLTANASNLQLHRQNVREFAGALAQNVGQPLLGVFGIGQPCLQIHILLRDFLAALRFAFNPAQQMPQRQCVTNPGVTQQSCKTLLIILSAGFKIHFVKRRAKRL